MDRKIIAIDYMSLLYKAFYGVRPMHSSDGTPTNAVYGFLNMFLKLLSDHEPDCIFVASDESRHTFRTDIYSDYKGGRDAMPEDMRLQVPVLIDILRAAGVKFISAEGYEADDIIGFIATQAEKNSDRLTIVTGDRDSFQLASDDVSILYAKRGVSDTVDVTPEYIREEYGLAPKQLIELKALMGDKSDNIPGVAGVGEKTALELIKTYSSVDGVYENIDSIKGKLRDKLIADRDNAYMSRRLGEILRDLPVELDYDTADDFDMKRPEVIEILSKYELKSIIRNLGAEEEKKADTAEEISFIDEMPPLSALRGKTCCVYMSDPEISSDIALCCDGRIYVVKDVSVVSLKELFSSDSGIELTVHDAKTLWKALKSKGIESDNIVFDTFVAAYVINSSDERYELPFITKKYLGEDIPEGPSGQKSFFDLTGEDPSLMARKVSAISRLSTILREKLSSDGEEALYYDIEHRLIFVLAEMEMLGFRVDREGLLEIGRDLNGRIEALTEKILETAGKGRDFNINSTKQLGALLFDELKLPVIKKTKTGYSTDSEVLEALYDAHPIIPMIIELRALSKLNSTYINGMADLIDPASRIHSSFNQTITTTGRISSSNPNLQNIPVRTEEGKVIRKVFVPSDEDSLIVSADYSQIELRVLAHIAEDDNMIEAFRSGTDIHTKTASEVFNVPISEVTKEMRSRAKAVNFGIVYGISDYGLAKNIGSTRKESKEYIESYLEKFPRVKEYMGIIVEFARQKGYVTTLYGRRRYLSDINSRNFALRSFSERTALNTPIQGTAADIIKIAMIAVRDELKKRNMRSKLILQIHDELIIDTKKDELEEVMQILRDKMENAAELRVPLIVDIGYGENWYETK